MAEHPDAHLSEEAWERVRLEQHEVNKRFWPEIGAMRVSTLELLASHAPFATMLPVPIMPKVPIKLFGILARYATEMYDCEYREYPSIDQRQWGAKLIRKIEQVVMVNLEFLNKSHLPGTTHHATYDEMRVAVRKALQAHYLAASVNLVGPPPTLLLSAAESSGSPLPAMTPTIANPKSIGERLDDAALPSGHKDVWAAIGISKSSYFEVKAGRGGQKAKKKVELYLSSLESKAKKNSD